MIEYKNLVFKGGGVKGVAYAGALLELDERNIPEKITRVAGTSAGAITAALLAVGYTAEEIRDIVTNDMDFNSFKDKTWLPGNIQRFIKKYGWFKGNAFKTWMEKKIREKTGKDQATFKDLKTERNKYRELFVVSTNLVKQRAEIFSAENTPDIPISDAVRMSMCIPFYFKSVKWKKNIMVDGGMGYNYPVDLFDDEKYVNDPANFEKVEQGENIYKVNKETLGLWLDTKADINNLRHQTPAGYKKIKNIKEFTFSVVDYLMEMANMAHLENYDWERSILIDSLDVKATDFDKVKQKAQELIESGKKGVKDYFNWLERE